MFKLALFLKNSDAGLEKDYPRPVNVVNTGLVKGNLNAMNIQRSSNHVKLSPLGLSTWRSRSSSHLSAAQGRDSARRYVVLKRRAGHGPVMNEAREVLPSSRHIEPDPERPRPEKRAAAWHGAEHTRPKPTVHEFRRRYGRRSAVPRQGELQCRNLAYMQPHRHAANQIPQAFRC